MSLESGAGGCAVVVPSCCRGDVFSDKTGQGGCLIKGREQRVVLVASDQICIFN